MRKTVSAGLVALALGLMSASGASAATEVGSNCEADGGFVEDTVLPLADPTGLLPIAVPADGVVTSWKVNSSLPAPRPHVMEVFRPTETPGEFTLVEESALETVVQGRNAFATRISVKQGDRFGLVGPPPDSITLTCNSASIANVVGSSVGAVVQGTAQAFSEQPGFEVPLAAVVEPDADGDGFGDDSQDGCPQSAAFHSACPVLQLDSVAQAGRSSVVLFVSSSIEAPVTVTGTVALPTGKRARSAAKATLKGGTRTVTPGKLARFKLRFPANLRTALAALPPGRSLTLKLKATASAPGQSATDSLGVKLKRAPSRAARSGR